MINRQRTMPALLGGGNTNNVKAFNALNANASHFVPPLPRHPRSALADQHVLQSHAGATTLGSDAAGQPAAHSGAQSAQAQAQAQAQGGRRSTSGGQPPAPPSPSRMTAKDKDGAKSAHTSNHDTNNGKDGGKGEKDNGKDTGSSPSSSSTSTARVQFIESPFRGIYGYSHIPVRRIGFVGIPLTALVLCHLPVLLKWFPTFESKVCILCLLWANLFLCKILLSILVLGFSVRRATRLGKLPETFYQIRAL